MSANELMETIRATEKELQHFQFKTEGVAWGGNAPKQKGAIGAIQYSKHFTGHYSHINAEGLRRRSFLPQAKQVSSQHLGDD